MKVQAGHKYLLNNGEVCYMAKNCYDENNYRYGEFIGYENNFKVVMGHYNSYGKCLPDDGKYQEYDIKADLGKYSIKEPEIVVKVGNKYLDNDGDILHCFGKNNEGFLFYFTENDLANSDSIYRSSHVVINKDLGKSEIVCGDFNE